MTSFGDEVKAGLLHLCRNERRYMKVPLQTCYIIIDLIDKTVGSVSVVSHKIRYLLEGEA